MLRNLQALQAVDHLKSSTDSLEQRTRRSRNPTSAIRSPISTTAPISTISCRGVREQRQHGTPLSVAFADLDRFKSVNDTFGHATGDQILVTTANILKANVRAADVVARYGGEEFMLVFPNTDYGF